jgi:hypothetical protein
MSNSNKTEIIRNGDNGAPIKQFIKKSRKTSYKTLKSKIDYHSHGP